MSETTDLKTWHGNDSMEGMLVPVGDLHPHPRNPRQGVTPEIQKSLSRFGQQRPVLALPDGTLVAGHHVWHAAVAEGWTHIAVVSSNLTTSEVDAYLLADNRLADLGLYDDRLLADLLAELGADGMDGTGYSTADLDELLAALGDAELAPAGTVPTPAELPAGLGEAELFRIMLTYDQGTYERIVGALDDYAQEHDLDSYSQAIERIVLSD